MQAQQLAPSPERMALRTARRVREQLSQPALALQDRAIARALEPTVRALTHSIGALYSAEVTSGEALVGCLGTGLNALGEALQALQAADAVGGGLFTAEVSTLREAQVALEPAHRVLRARAAKPPPLPPEALLRGVPCVASEQLEVTTTGTDDFEDAVTTRPEPAPEGPQIFSIPATPHVTTRSGLPRPVRRELSNRREHPRHYLDVDVDFQSDTALYTGFAEDISPGGLFIATYTVLDVGTALTVSLSMPDGIEITVDARVRWVRHPFDRSSDLSPGMGVTFENLLPKDRAAIERFMQHAPPRSERPRA